MLCCGQWVLLVVGVLVLLIHIATAQKNGFTQLVDSQTAFATKQGLNQFNYKYKTSSSGTPVPMERVGTNGMMRNVSLQLLKMFAIR